MSSSSRPLEQRPPGTTTVDALHGYLSTVGSLDESAKLRKQIVSADEGLRRSERARPRGSSS